MKNIVKKSNDLVEGQYALSIWEMRLFLKMLTMVDLNDTDFKEYRIELGDFIKEFELEKNKNAYTLLRDGARGLLKKIIVITKKLEDGTTEALETPMVNGVAHNIERKSYVKLSFHPAMKPYLLELKNKFLMYDVRNILSLPSTYAIRIYELTKQYAKIGKRTISIEELKRMLDIENKYNRYTHLKQKVITPSIENINEHTDIMLDYNEIKEGRRVVKLQFIIGQKDLPNKKTDKLSELLKQYKISDSVSKEWRSKYGDQHILERIRYMKAQDNVKNYGGYLNSIMDKELKPETAKMTDNEVTRRVNAIMFSNPSLEQKIRNKYGELSQSALNSVIKKTYPERFR